MTKKNDYHNSLILMTEEHFPSFGGIQRLVLEIYKFLKKYNPNTRLIYIYIKGGREKGLEQQLDNTSYSISPKYLPKWIAPLFLYLQITKKTPAVWVLNFNLRQVIVSIIGKWFKQTQNIALFIYGRELILYRKLPPIIRQIVYGWNKYILLRGVNHFFAISHFSSQLLQREYKISFHKITLCQGGIHPQPVSRQPSEYKNGLPSHPVVHWLTISRQISRKGIHYAIGALHAIKKRTSLNIQYIIVGNGYMRSKLEKLVIEYQLTEMVFFLDHISEQKKQQLFQKADLFVLPVITEKHDVEGMGITYLEAATYRVPSVGFQSGGTADAVIHNETGFLVQEKDINALTNALLKLSTNHQLRQQMGEKAFHFVSTQRSWERMGNILIQQLKL